MTDTARKNKLCLGGNRDLPRGYVAPDSIDLIYPDPPFDSDAAHNALFQEKGEEKSAARISNGHIRKSMLLTRCSQRLSGPRHE